MGVGRREILTPRSDANCGDGKGREWQVSLADAGQRKTPAAGCTGVSWLRDVKLFRISLGISQRRPLRGQWHIEPAELHRVYPPRTEASTNERIRAYLAEIALLRDRIEDLKTLTDEFRVWVRDLTEQREPRSAPPSWTSGYWPINRPCRPYPPRAYDGGAGSRAHPPEHRLISRRRFSGRHRPRFPHHRRTSSPLAFRAQVTNS